MRTIGVDTGGTFTDLVSIDDRGRVTFDKAFSTPKNPEQGILDAVDQLCRAEGTSVSALLSDTSRIAHGTTVSTNALIQRRGARVGLLTTQGFEDTLFIGRGPVGRTGGLPLSKALDFLHTETPAPLVPKALTRGVAERIDSRGLVLAAPDPDQVRDAIRQLVQAGAESLAICLLWSFRNPAHERMVAEIARQVAPNLPISLSCEIAPRMGEYERMITTVVNAFIGPITERYIGNLQLQLKQRGFAQQVQVMKSSGGVTSPERVGREAVSVVNSGPIGGLIAARHVGRLLGFENIITADMGGTSFDVGIISQGAFEEQNQPFLDQGLPVQIPAIKVVTIGAGGGSIAWTDGFRLHVGPQSAGADPGPVCYGRGGVEPTVTDALVALGIVNPANFFGGRHKLDPTASHRAIEERVAKPLGLTTIEAAAGIYEVVTSRMADLIRKATVESGNDPREFCLLSYGGAGGAHCADFSAQLGIARVVIPYTAPVFSAFGCAFSDVLCTHSKSVPVRLERTPDMLGAVTGTLQELRDKVVADMAMAGFPSQELTVRYKFDVRYEGQMNEITLVWDRDAFTAEDVDRLRGAFERQYQQRFGEGTTNVKHALELISFRAEATRETRKPDISPVFAPGPKAEPEGSRQVYVHGKGWVDAAVYQFETLTPDHLYEGPAVIERKNTTIWLPPGANGRLDVFGNLEIQRGE